MSFWSEATERLRTLVFRSREERELAEELALHVELEAEHLQREHHLPPAEARRRACLALGGTDQISESVRDARGTRLLDELGQDLRYALRQVRRSPGFTAAVVLTLALGIGANAIMFGVVDRLLLRPPTGVAAPDCVVRIYFQLKAPDFLPTREVFTVTQTTFPLIPALRQVPAFAGVAGYFRTGGTVGRGPDARKVDLALVTGDFFHVLGARPALGRFFGPDEDRLPAGSPVVVVSYGFWRRVLGGRPGAIGGALRLEDRVVTVVGVAPPDFTGVDLDPVDVWAPTSLLAAAHFGREWATTPGSIWINAITRLRPGVTPAQAGAEATVVYRRAVAGWSRTSWDAHGRVILGSVIAARGPGDMPREARVSLWLEGVAAIVLLVACANVASLLLARAVRRRREIAVRLALGVGRGRLVRQLLTETSVLATLAAAAAVVLTFIGGRAVRTVLLQGLALDNPLDGRVLLFLAATTLAAMILAGLAPAFRSARVEVAPSLKTGTAGRGGRRPAAHAALLVVQTSLCVVLLVGGGLFARSLARVHGLDVGIDLARVLQVRVELNDVGFSPARIEETWRAARERVRRVPGVESATLVRASVPMSTISGWAARLPGRDSWPNLPGGGPYGAAIEPGYFHTLGARILRGRGISEADEATGARVAVVNRTLEKYYWPGHGALGQCLLIGDDPGCTQVVGVVQDVLTFSLVGDERAFLYLPTTHPTTRDRAGSPGGILVRTTGDEARVARGVQAAVQSLAPDMPYVSVASFDQLIAPELRPWRLGATMFGLFGALALAIAAIGLFSVLAYAVAQRTHEIGVRVALGAGRGDVVRMVVLDGVRLVAYGLGLGVLLALAAGRFVAPLLYDTSPRDPRVFGAVVAVLLIAAVAASLLPARRAAGVDPARALAAE